MTSIVAYTYQAEILCPGCAIAAVSAIGARGVSDGNVERALDLVARFRGIDRTDEHTFDSDEFPKVVFSSQIEDVELCGKCHGEV